MSIVSSARRVLLAAVVSGVALTAPAAAQPSIDSVPYRVIEDAPEAAEIFERYIEAIGGQAALDALQTREIRGVYEGPPFDLPARLYMFQEKPNKLHLKIEQPLGATIEMAYDGELAWERTGDDNVRELAGTRLGEFLDTADFLGEANYKNRYTSIETLGIAQLSGRDVWLIAAKPLVGQERRLAFDPETGLFVGTVTSSTTPNGEMLIAVYLREYEEFGGVRYPTVVEQAIVGGRGVINTFRYLSVETNVEGEHDYSAPGEVLPSLEATKAAGDE